MSELVELERLNGELFKKWRYLWKEPPTKVCAICKHLELQFAEEPFARCKKLKIKTSLYAGCKAYEEL